MTPDVLVEAERDLAAATSLEDLEARAGRWSGLFAATPMSEADRAVLDRLFGGVVSRCTAVVIEGGAATSGPRSVAGRLLAERRLAGDRGSPPTVDEALACIEAAERGWFVPNERNPHDNEG